jgi:hypothetical protein
MALRGQYADLFTLQAAAYTTGGSDELQRGVSGPSDRPDIPR